MSEQRKDLSEEHPAASRLREAFPEAVVEVVSFHDEVTITVAGEAIEPICRFLKEHPDLQYDFLANLCGVDASGTSTWISRPSRV